MDNAPYFLLALLIADEHRKQLSDIQAIGLGAAFPAIHFDARGIHDEIGNPCLPQVTM